MYIFILLRPVATWEEGLSILLKVDGKSIKDQTKSPSTSTDLCSHPVYLPKSTWPKMISKGQGSILQYTFSGGGYHKVTWPRVYSAYAFHREGVKI